MVKICGDRSDARTASEQSCGVADLQACPQVWAGGPACVALQRSASATCIEATWISPNASMNSNKNWPNKDAARGSSWSMLQLAMKKWQGPLTCCLREQAWKERLGIISAEVLASLLFEIARCAKPHPGHSCQPGSHLPCIRSRLHIVLFH